jgi:hypothetical protein
VHTSLRLVIQVLVQPPSAGEYHQMKIDFILTVGVLLSNLWDTFASSLGMS